MIQFKHLIWATGVQTLYSFLSTAQFGSTARKYDYKTMWPIYTRYTTRIAPSASYVLGAAQS